MRRTRGSITVVAVMTVFVVVGVPASGLTPGATGRSSRSPVEPMACPLVPTVPEGWFVYSTAPEGAVPPGEEFTLFGNLDDRGRLRGPALAVGVLGDLDIAPNGLFRGSQRKVRIGGREATLSRTGRDVRLLLPTDAQDVAVLFAGRGLTEAQVIGAARRTSFKGSPVQLDPGGIPKGLDELVTAPIGPIDTTLNRRTFGLIDEAEHRVVGSMYRASRPARALQRFWVESPAPANNGSNAAMAVTGPNVVVVAGEASETVLQQIADSAQCEGSEGWSRFRARTADLPARVVLQGDVGDALIVDGTDLDVRWAVAFAVRSAVALSGPTARIGAVAPEGFVGASEELISFPATPQIAVINSLDVGTGTIVAGYLPATATTLAVSHPDGSPVRTMILDTGPDPTLRYFVALVPPVTGPPRAGLVTPVTALDAAGNIVGHCDDLGFSCRAGYR